MIFRRKLPGLRSAPIIVLLIIFMTVMQILAGTGRSISGNTDERDGDRHARAENDEASDFGSKAIKEAEEERSYRRDNVAITVKKLYAEERYYWNFEVTVENLNDIKKTVEGKICLYNMYIQPRECGYEECGVKMAVQPKSVLAQKFRCRGKMDVNSWAFLIQTIHNY